MATWIQCDLCPKKGKVSDGFLCNTVDVASYHVADVCPGCVPMARAEVQAQLRRCDHNAPQGNTARVAGEHAGTLCPACVTPTIAALRRVFAARFRAAELAAKGAA